MAGGPLAPRTDSGATDAAIQLELFNVLNEFFQDSNIWQEEIDFSVLSTDDPATKVYYIEAESVASINRLLGIVNSDDAPIYGTMQVPGEIILNTQPGQDDRLGRLLPLGGPNQLWVFHRDLRLVQVRHGATGLIEHLRQAGVLTPPIPHSYDI